MPRVDKVYRSVSHTLALKHMRATLLILAVLALTACGGSDATGPRTDACAQELSDAYTNYGTPTQRVEASATETDLFWGRTKREYIRQGSNSCFVSSPIQT